MPSDAAVSYRRKYDSALRPSERRNLEHRASEVSVAMSLIQNIAHYLRRSGPLTASGGEAQIFPEGGLREALS